MHWENRPVTNISPVPSQSELFSLRLHRYRCPSCCCEQAQWQGQVPCKAAKATSAGFSISPNAGLAARKRYLLLCNKKKKFATTAMLSSSDCTCIQGCCKIVVMIAVKIIVKIAVKIVVKIVIKIGVKIVLMIVVKIVVVAVSSASSVSIFGIFSLEELLDLLRIF